MRGIAYYDQGMDHEDVDLRTRAAAMFRVLSSPIRLQLLELLAGGERTVTQLVEATGHSQPLVSQHLRVLRDQCLVTTRRQGRESHYSVLDDHVLHVVADALAHARKHCHDDPGPGATEKHDQEDA